MRSGRLILLVVLAGFAFSPILAIGGYGWYLRSGAYRDSCAANVSELVGLPTEIGGVVPRSWSVREFRDVTVWLPQRRDVALKCPSVRVIQKPTADAPDGYEMAFLGGSCEISARTWLREDYRGVFESGVRPGFDPNGPARATFGEMDVVFAWDDSRARMQSANGLVDFRERDHGTAHATCYTFNGYESTRPFLLTLNFSPRANGVQIDDLTLTVPEIPLSAVGLDKYLAGQIEHGRFAGSLTYSEQDNVRRFVAEGRCFDLHLAEITCGLTPTPWTGACPEIELQELRVENRVPQRVRFRGILEDVDLASVLETWGFSEMTGRLDLSIGSAELSPSGVQSLIASGRCADVLLEGITSLSGYGRMSGRLSVHITDLHIVDNHIRSLDAYVGVEPADDPPNWIEGRLLESVAERALGLRLPSFLPERIEYTQLGFKLEIRDEVLYVFGSHGEDSRTILTVRLFGREIPIVFEPKRAFDLQGWLDEIRARGRQEIERRVRESGVGERGG